jgi:chemotaxis methyl-accepting protein methylase
VTADRGDGFARWVLNEAGLEAGAYRGQSLERRVPACLRALKVRTEQEAPQRIAERPDLLEVAVSSLLVGVTEFFRDPDVFEGLRKVVLPALAQRRGTIRAWSAGCSSGTELYSFAMLLAESGLLDRTYLLGTDCRPDVIRQARHARYDIAAARGPCEPLFRKYFEPASGDTWRPAERLRRRVEWKVADVFRTTAAGPWDVIFWRNVAIYLNPGPSTVVCGRLIREIAHGGFLVLGKAERPPEHGSLPSVHRCVFRRP